MSSDAHENSDPEKNLGELNRHSSKLRGDGRGGLTKADGREGFGQLRVASFRERRARPSILTHA